MAERLRSISELLRSGSPFPPVPPALRDEFATIIDEAAQRLRRGEQ